MEKYHAMLTSEDRLMFYGEEPIMASNDAEARSKGEAWAAAYREANPGQKVFLEIRNAKGQGIP